MIHVISDLDLHYFSKEEEQHILDPNVTLIVITGNISNVNKRSMLYAEELAKQYPRAQVIFNFGFFESRLGVLNIIRDGFENRINLLKQCQPNLHYPSKGTIVGNYDFFCTLGWPKFANYNNLQESFISGQIYENDDEHLYIGNQLVNVQHPRLMTKTYISNEVEKECYAVKQWLTNKNNKKKILISSCGDWSNRFFGNNEYTVFDGLDLSDIVWFCGGDYKFIGKYRNAHVVCLPGRNRSRNISEKTFTLADLEDILQPRDL